MKRWWSAAVVVVVAAAMTVAMTGSARAAGADPGCDFFGDGGGDIAVGVPGDVNGPTTAAGGFDVIDGKPKAVDHAHAFFPAEPEQDAFVGAALACGDFNGDGVDDLASGAPGAERVDVFQGGLTDLRHWHTLTPDDFDVHSAFNHFGHALAVGDFNGDGFDDLAIGAPSEPRPNDGWTTGAVHVIAGSPHGLGGDHRTLPAFGGMRQFGAALSTGDIDGDGLDDLAVGVPDGMASGETQIGTALTFLGTPDNLIDPSTKQETPFQEDMGGQTGGDGFGSALAFGDFNHDGFDDLAVGAPFNDDTAGEVYVMLSNGHFIDYVGAERWTVTLAKPTVGDLYGYSLAAGDFNGDRIDELAIAVDLQEICSAGIVEVRQLRGYYRLLEGSGQCDGHFGYGMSAADLDSDGIIDLAIGSPGVTVTGITGAGDVRIYRGSREGPQFLARYDQSVRSPGYVESAEPCDVGLPFKSLEEKFLHGESMGASITG